MFVEPQSRESNIIVDNTEDKITIKISANTEKAMFSFVSYMPLLIVNRTERSLLKQETSSDKSHHLLLHRHTVLTEMLLPTPDWRPEAPKEYR